MCDKPSKGYLILSTILFTGFRFLTNLTEGSSSGLPSFCTQNSLEHQGVGWCTSSRAPDLRILLSSFLAVDSRNLEYTYHPQKLEIRLDKYFGEHFDKWLIARPCTANILFAVRYSSLFGHHIFHPASRNFLRQGT